MALLRLSARSILLLVLPSPQVTMLCKDDLFEGEHRQHLFHNFCTGITQFANSVTQKGTHIPT